MAIKQGTDELFLIRKLGDAKDANKVMWITELERETERDSDTEATVDGSVASGGSLESTVSGTAYMDNNDPLSDEIEDATEDGTPYETWVINKKVKNAQGKYKAEYRQGYWNSITRTNEADSIAEFEWEYGVYGKKQRGFATLPPAIEANKAAYGFHDTIAADPADDGLADIPQPTEGAAQMVESITLSAGKSTIAPQETTTVTADVQPSDAAIKGVTYSTDDTDYVSVDADSGVVTGKADGTATITATAKDGSGVTGTVQITVQTA
ncbi:phage major tail protein, TP901-1 family [Staphylococcus chromogenes]|nr:phage major tail protein, TP901-1 family [Staphylococcus chromogenes]TJY13997.1 phage major tail protein, TP901-1 family [Staphylococcus chromogenes]